MSDYLWTLKDAAGTELRATQAFDSKADAEAWMGAEWSGLRREGADTVTLSKDGEVLYEMSLHEA